MDMNQKSAAAAVPSYEFENRQLRDVTVSESRDPFVWNLYWLKQNEYNSRIHTSFKPGSDHTHSFFEIHFFTEGSCTYRIEDAEVTATAGEFLFFCPKTKHSTVQRSDIMKKIAIGFDVFAGEEDERLSALLEVLRSGVFFQANFDDSVVMPLQLILESCDRQTEHAPIVKRSLLNSFLFSLLDVLFGDLQMQERAPVRVNGAWENDEIFQAELMNYLAANIRQNVSLEAVSKALSVSTSQIKRRLMRYSGMTFQQVKDKVKASMARELLSTNMSMAQISEALGISNEYSFNRFFKRVEGMTPGKFREAMQTGNYK